MGILDSLAASASSVKRRRPQAQKRTFHREGGGLQGKAYAHNKKFATPRLPTHYQTQLSPIQEAAFRNWVAKHKVPFNVHAKRVDYDMRGYYKSTGGAPHKPGQHFPDTYKTPFDTTFSRESKYATKRNPFTWRGNRLIDRRTGRVIFSPK